MNITQNETKKWLVVCFIHNIQNEGSDPDYYINTILEEIKEGGCKEVTVLVIVDKIKKIDREKNMIHFETTFKKLINKQGIDDYWEDVKMSFNYTNGRSWALLLSKINNHFPAERVAIVTVSHGAGVGFPGIQKDDIKNIPENPLKKHPLKIAEALYLPSEYAAHRLHNEENIYSCFDNSALKYIEVNKKTDPYCKHWDMLWMNELNNALNAGFGDKKIDIMFMNNCCMQSFETGWLLRKQVRYLIAPESLINVFGCNFKALLTKLNLFPNMRTKEVLKAIPLDYTYKLYNQPDYRIYTESANIFVVNLSYYTVLMYVLERICKRLCRASNSNIKKITQARLSFVRDVTNGFPGSDVTGRIHFVDINWFLDIARNVLYKDWLLQTWAFALKKITIMSIVTKYVSKGFEERDRSSIEKYRLSGISIFVPNERDFFDADVTINCAYFGSRYLLNTSKPILAEFAEKSHWDDFIRLYVLQLA